MIDKRGRPKYRRDGAHNRRAARNQHICLAWVQTAGNTGSAIEGIARVMDVSSRGIGLVCAVPFECGQLVAVEILVVGSLRLHAKGEVAHSSPSELGYRIGIAFVDSPVLVDSPTDAPPPSDERKEQS